MQKKKSSPSGKKTDKRSKEEMSTDYLQTFKDYLQTSQEASSATVKNYLSDIRKFQNWIEAKTGEIFSPNLITPEHLEEFKAEMRILSVNSSDRYISSLRKFYAYLEAENLITTNPFKLQDASLKLQETDMYHLKGFKNSLYASHASEPTIKNYMADIKQFTIWLDEVMTDKHSYVESDKNPLASLNTHIIEEYKSRLHKTADISPVSINRKLSSIRKYLAFLLSQGVIESAPFVINAREHEFSHEGIEDSENSKETATETIAEDLPTSASPMAAEEAVRRYSRFGPLALLQRIASLSNLIFDLLMILPLVKAIEQAQYLFVKFSGKGIFTAAEAKMQAVGLAGRTAVKAINSVEGLISSRAQKSQVKGIHHFITRDKRTLADYGFRVSNLPKEMYAPISVKNLPFHKKLLHHARFTRPAWYKKYHSYAITHYFHFAILMIVVTTLGVGVYNGVFNKARQTPTLAAVPTAPPRILSFQGRLTDASDNPITATTNLRFAIYNDTSASGSALLWQEVKTMTPDTDGIFNTYLGQGTAIPSTVFTDNATLYLGITVGTNDTELTPRQQIATVAFAANSETLQGLLPITGVGAGQTNVVLALDSSGNLTIGGSASPTFQATGGQFKVAGQSVVINTNTGSNGDITFQPDGLGKVDIQKALYNSTLNSQLPTAAGALNVDDLFAVNATSSGQSLVTLNQNGAGPLISASVSGVARFTVDNSGNGTFAGNLGVNGGDITSSNVTGNIFNSTVSTLQIGGAATSLTLGATTGTLALRNPTINLGGGSATTIQTTSNTTLTLGGNTTGDIIVGPQNGAAGGTIRPSTNNLVDLGTASFAYRNLYVSNIIGASSGVNGYWQRNASAIAPANITDDVLVGGVATASALIKLGGTTNASSFFNTGGNVAIGTTNPTNKLTVAGALELTTDTNPTAEILYSGGSALNIYTSSSNDLHLGTNNSARLTVLGSSGNVGVGTTTPFGKLNVVGSATSPIGKAALVIIQNETSQDLFTASAGATPRFVIRNDGNVGIGTATPQFPLDVVGAGQFTGRVIGANAVNPNEFVTLSQLNGTNYWQMVSGALSPFSSSLDVLVGGNATASAKIKLSGTANDSFFNTGGNLGIGTTTVRNFLDVRGSTSNSNALVNFVQSGTADIFTASAGATTRFTITNNGNIGVGTSLPASTLEVRGTTTGNALARFIQNTVNADVLTASASANSLLTLRYNGNLGLGTSLPTSFLDARGTSNSSNALVKLVQNGNADIFAASAGATTRFVIANNGNIGIGTSLPAQLFDVQGGSGIVGQFSGRVIGANAVNSNEFVTLSQLSGNQYWQRALGALAPFNITDDLLAGGIATNSAKFAVLNMIGAGTPTASVSAQNAAGAALVLGGDGTIQSVRKNTLTIGGATTGNIDISTDANARLVTIGNTTGTSALTLNSGTGAIGIGTSIAKTITIGNVTGATGLALNSGTGGIALTSTSTGDITAASADTLLLDSAGVLELNSSGGVISIGNDAVAQNINLGTGAAARTLAIGNVTGATAVNVSAGTGGISLASTSTGDIIATSADTLLLDSAGVLELNSSGGIISIGNDAVAQNINLGTGAAARTIAVGNVTGATAVNVSAGTGGISLASTSTGDITLLSSDQLLLRSSKAAGATTTEAIQLASTSDLGAADELLTIGDSAGTFMTFMGNGNIGVGTSTPLATLDVRGNLGTTPAASVSGLSSFAALIVDNSGVGDLFTASKSGATKFVVKNNGNIGIGTSQPAQLFDVQGGSGIVGQFSGRVVGGNAVASNEFVTLAQLNGTNYWQMLSGALSPFSSSLDVLTGATATASALVKLPGTNNTNAFFNLGTGNLGVGTNNPTSRLHVVTAGAATNALAITDGTNYTLAGGYHASGVGYFGGIVGSQLSLYANGSEKVRLALNGNLGIGSTTPAGLLDVNGTTTGNALARFVQNTVNADVLTASASANTLFTLRYNGNLGLGTSLPTSFLDVRGTSNSSNALMKLVQSGNADIFAASSGATTKFVINNAGNVGIGTSLPAQLLDVQGGSGIVGQFSGRVIGANAVNSNEFATLAQVTGTTYWQRALGALSPTNITDDVLIGGTATASAKIRLGGTTNANSFFNTGGNLGIGTTTPNAMLHVYSSSTNVATFDSVGGDVSTTYANGGSDVGYVGYGGLVFDTPALATSFGIRSQTSLAFSTLGGNTRLFIDTTGNVGVGSTSPGATLDVNWPNVTANNGKGISFTGTLATTGGGDNAYGIKTTIANSPSAANQAYGYHTTITDSTALASSIYGTVNNLTLTGNATKNGYGFSTTVTNSATTASGGIYGYDATVTRTGVLTSGSQSTYGGQFLAAASGVSTGGSQVVFGTYNSASTALSNGASTTLYGTYSSAGGTVASGTLTAYGLYVANGGYSTTGTTKAIGLNIEAITGADLNYAAIFEGGNVGIGTTAPDNFKLEMAGSVGPTTDLTYDLGSLTKQWNNIYGGNIYSNGLPVTQFWQRNLGALSPASITNDLLVGSTATASAIVKLPGITNQNALFNLGTGNVGIGSVTPGAKLDIGFGSLAGTNPKGISNTGTIATTTATSGYGVYNSITNAPSTNANFSYGIYNLVTDNTSLGNSNYGIWSQVDSTGNISKNQYAGYFTNSNTSTVGGTVLGVAGVGHAAGNITTGTFTIKGGDFAGLGIGTSTGGTRDVFGLDVRGSVSNGNGSTDNVYGLRVAGGGTVTSGTLNSYGIRINNASGMNTTGTTSNIGLYVDAVSGADVNYAAIFAGGSVGLGTTAPLATLDVRGQSATTPIASFSGTTTFAGLLVDNGNASADLITASRSGSTKFTVNGFGDILAGQTVLDGTTTANGAGTSTTTLVLTSAASFDVGNYIAISSTNCVSGVAVCYAKIMSKATNTLTLSNSLSWANGSVVSELHIAEIGGIDLNSSLTRANRYGTGYFIGGVVAGNSSTYYMDRNIYVSDGGDLSLTGGNVIIGSSSALAKFTIRQDNVDNLLALRDGNYGNSLTVASGGAILSKPTSFLKALSCAGASCTSGDTGTFTDSTSEASTSAGTAFTTVGTGTTATFYVGLDKPFASVYFSVAVQAAGTALVREYWNGTAWTAMPANNDATLNLRFSNAISFPTMPSDWTANKTVNAVTGLYWMRFRSSTNVTTANTSYSVSPTTGNRFTLYAQNGDLTPALTASDSGYIGINTTNPTDRLTVNGNLQASNFRDYENPAYYLDPAAVGTSLVVNGNVGVGITNPTSVGGGGSPRVLQLHNTGSNAYGNLVLSGNSTTSGEVLGELDFATTGSAGEKRTAAIASFMTGTSSSNAVGDMRFYTANGGAVGEKMRIQADGNVGIGSTGPNYTLDINAMQGNTSAKLGPGLSLYAVNSVPTLGFNAYFNGGWKYGKTSSSNYGGYIDLNTSNGTMSFNVTAAAGNADAALTGAPAMHIDRNGNVGIGTSGPSQELTLLGYSAGAAGTTMQVVGTAGSGTVQNQLNLTATAGSYGLTLGSNNSGVATSNYHCANCGHIVNVLNANLNLGANNTVAMSITGGGNVGIGTTASSNAKLYVSGGFFSSAYNCGGCYPTFGNAYFTQGWNFTGGAGEVDFWNNSNGGSPQGFRFYNQTGASSANLLMTMEGTTGNIGIGTSSPLANLTVGTSAGNGVSLGQNDPASGAWWRNNGSDSVISTNVGSMYYGYSGSSKNLFFYPGGTTAKMTINTNGNIGFRDSTAGSRQFSFMGSLNGGSVASFMNTNTTDDANQGVLLIGQGTNSSTATRWIKFYYNCTADSYAGCTGRGSIRPNGSGALQLDTTAADYGEWMLMGEDVSLGDIISFDNNAGKKASRDEHKIVGVISNNSSVVGNSSNDSESPGLNHQIVGQIGQVKTHVATTNGPIKRGDRITAGLIPGVGEKATIAGQIVGAALEDFNPNNPSQTTVCPVGTDSSVKCGTILLYINPSWYDPDVYLTDTGNLNVHTDAGGNFVAFNASTAVSRIGIFASAVIANLKAGAIEAQKVTTQSLAIGTQNITIAGQSLQDYIIAVVTQANIGGGGPGNNLPELTVQNLKTNLISPLASQSAVVISGKVFIAGNPQVSGPSLEVSGDASISGTLRAKRIIADDIEGLNARIASLSANTITASSAAIAQITNVTNVYTATGSGQIDPAYQNGIPNLLSGSIQTNYANIASLSGQFAQTTNLQAEFGQFNQGLMSLGPTSLSDTSVTGQLSIDGNMVLAENTINVLGADLQIQPLRQGGVSFEGGLIAINTDGDLTVGGSAFFKKDVRVEGTLMASMIRPIPDGDITIQLASSSAHESQFAITNASGSSVLTVNQKGDVTASGSGFFKNIASNIFNIVRGAQADTSVTETVASGSAGTAVIKRYYTERTIFSPYVTEKSLIYVTATSDTQGQTPYIARQTAEDIGTNTKGSFTVQIPTTVSQDIKINWWIVN